MKVWPAIGAAGLTFSAHRRAVSLWHPGRAQRADLRRRDRSAWAGDRAKTQRRMIAGANCWRWNEIVM